ncbi:MAG: alpha/beta fold hydrolase [Planctomycetota bacterium]|nr:alpha/beta fold hydrolase [Planctomycetota bacterium]
MLLTLLQLLLIAIYTLFPLATLALALYVRLRRRRSAPLISFFLNCIAAIIFASAFLLLNRHLMAGRIATDDGLRLIYLTLAVICLLRLLDRLLLRCLFRLARVSTNPLGHPLPSARFRALIILLAQRFVMLAIILSYVPALIITCRPKMLRDGNILSRHSLAASLAQFTTRDRLLLTGWWIPTQPHPPRNTDPELAAHWAQHTVLLCHGVGSAKEDLIPLAKFLVENGLNVLVFDFRAHGQSEGTFFSYGDRERLDILAAARWVRANHLEQAQRLFGIGINTGAAALIAAAVDPTQGRDLDALVLYEPFARFSTLAASVADDTLHGLFGWLVHHISLPISSLHAGTNLLSFAPADLAPQLWPRPVLLVHGRGTTFIPTAQSMDLYNQIPFPRQRFFPAEAFTNSRDRFRRAQSDTDLFTEMFRQWLGTANRISEDPGVQDTTLRFLINAQPLPVI